MAHMNLAAQYERQSAWRHWEPAYEALPPLAGARVLDLGCGVGAQARDLARRGARVTGIDRDAELVASAMRQAQAGTAFEVGDIRALAWPERVDGLWSSFAAAYLGDLLPVLAHWRGLLKPGGWLALTEVAGLLDHEPLPAGCRAFLRAFERQAVQAGRYDFGMGARLAAHLRASGFEVRVERVLPDDELSFQGPAAPDVLAAWGQRLDRMPALQRDGARVHPAWREEFLAGLADAAHRSACRVHFCLAFVPA